MAQSVGVELGPAAVRGVLLERAGPRFKTSAAHEIPCDASNPDLLPRALADLRRVLKIRTPVILGVPSTSAILATVTPLVATPQRAELAVEFELQQQLPYDLPEAAWHYHGLANGDGPSGRATTVRAAPRGAAARPPAPVDRLGSSGTVVAAMKRALLDERLGACARAGISVRAVAINPIATFNAWALATLPASSRTLRACPPTALLNLVDDHLVEWIVWTGSSLHVAPVTVTPQQEVWPELRTSWEALQSQFPGAAGALWMIGTEAALPKVRDALQGGPARIERLETTGIASPPRASNPERFTTAIGLAAQAAGQVPLPLNLLAGHQRQAQAARTQRGLIFVCAVLAIAACGFGLSGMLEQRQRRVRVLRALEQQERVYQALRPDVRALLQAQEQITRRAAQLQQAAAEAVAVTGLAAQAAEALPDEIWLTTFDATKGPAAVTATIEGRAASFQDVTRFFDRLKTAPGMAAVKPLATNVVADPASGKEYIAFSVEVQRLLRPEEPPAERSR
jgi:Tfp pilus assembly protein PilN